MLKIEDVLNKIPHIDVFLTPDEMDENTLALAKKYPHLVTVTKVGESRKKHPLYCLKIGEGKKKALMYGCPHPNEPIGCMMLEHLSRLLCENEDILQELDTTFYMIKAVDPDGLNLNKGWLKGPFTYANYASHFFRPASAQQVEWTFPITYKNYSFNEPVPETQAIMKLMEEIKPDFVYTLHNSSFGGVYFYVNRDDPHILPKLPDAAKRAHLPLNLGEPECAFSKTYAPAIYEFLQAPQYYDYYEETLEGDPCDYMVCGGSSLDYMNTINPDAFVMMCEEPYFHCPDSNDLSLCDHLSRREAIMQGFELRQKIVDFTKEKYAILKKYADPSTQYMLALAMYTKDDGSHKQATISLMDAHSEEYDVPATKASRFDNFVATPWYALLGVGMIIGSSKETLETMSIDDEGKALLTKLVEDSQAFIEDQCQAIDKQVPCRPIDIRTLVSVQMESALIVLQNI